MLGGGACGRGPDRGAGRRARARRAARGGSVVAEREYDVVLFGATGFTGALTAEYLAAHAPAGMRWALAGRNRQKLERVRDQLADGGELELVSADVTDAESMRALAERTRVVITTVGPYILYGEPLVAACADAGTDYVDLTGEPEFADQMWLKHHESAERSGARIVHCCGFDSIPHDLGALFTVQQLPEGEPLTVRGFVRARGAMSGGTYHTAIQNMGRLRQGLMAGRERRRRESPSDGRTLRWSPGYPHHDEDAGGWVLPFPSIDPQIVLRSARALERYGPEFTYSHYLVARRLPALLGITAGAGTAAALAQLPPTRSLLLRLKQAGDGPSAEERARNWFSVRFVGEGGGKHVVTEVAGGDPGYGDTAKMLSESALCLAFDELPSRAGQLTTAAAMGDALRVRLEAAGISFRVVQSS